MLNIKKAIQMLPIVMTISACAQTKTVPLGMEQESLISPIREVGVYTHPNLSEKFPRCVLILPVQKTEIYDKLSEAPTEILERHLYSKFERTIGLAEWRHTADSLGLDIRHPEDQMELAKELRCNAVLRARLIGSGMTNYFVWSQSNVGIESVMLGVADKQVLWRARHLADRSHGGLPLTPMGVLFDSYSAQRFALDQEAVLSILEDAVRRISSTL